MSKPELSTIPEFFHGYVNRVQEADVNEAIGNNSEEAISFLSGIPEEKWSYRYAEGKWSIREMVQHLVDAERVFAYRALCIARGETQSLPGFDEELYAKESKADGRGKDALLLELKVVRQSVELLFASFDEGQLAATGISNGNRISVAAIGFIIPGHVKHHLAVLRERYGV